MPEAARALGYTQPALTQQVQALEQSLRTPMVARSGSGSTLTEARNVLLRHGRCVLDHLSLAEAEVAALAGLRVGQSSL
ncbi:MAG: LysR family transcriptional regulator [Nakamurella sp.]